MVVVPQTFVQCVSCVDRTWIHVSISHGTAYVTASRPIHLTSTVSALFCNLRKITMIRSTGCVIYELIALEKFSEFDSNGKQLNSKIPRILARLMQL